jgi:hypothetical protein
MPIYEYEKKDGIAKRFASLRNPAPVKKKTRKAQESARIPRPPEGSARIDRPPEQIRPPEGSARIDRPPEQMGNGEAETQFEQWKEGWPRNLTSNSNDLRAAFMAGFKAAQVLQH